MKNFYLLCSFFVSAQFLTAQNIITQKIDEKLQLVDKSEITTDILYDRVFPMAKLLMFNESAADTSQASHFFQAYSEIQVSFSSKGIASELLDGKLKFNKYSFQRSLLSRDRKWIIKKMIPNSIKVLEIIDLGII